MQQQKKVALKILCIAFYNDIFVHGIVIQQTCWLATAKPYTPTLSNVTNVSDDCFCTIYIYKYIILWAIHSMYENGTVAGGRQQEKRRHVIELNGAARGAMLFIIRLRRRLCIHISIYTYGFVCFSFWSRSLLGNQPANRFFVLLFAISVYIHNGWRSERTVTIICCCAKFCGK